MSALITAVIPTIPTRRTFLTRAIRSVYDQTIKPIRISTYMDRQHRGSARTRNQALAGVSTMYSMFLDDDDFLLPNHAETLLPWAKAGFDVVYSGCKVVDGKGDEIPRQEEWGRFGQEFDPKLLRQKSYIPVTSLVDTEMAQAAWFGSPASAPDSEYDDWGFYLRLLDLGARFKHVPEVTWIWPHWGGNTSGRGDRW